jgi:hypothetical protein
MYYAYADQKCFYMSKLINSINEATQKDNPIAKITSKLIENLAKKVQRFTYYIKKLFYL